MYNSVKLCLLSRSRNLQYNFECERRGGGWKWNIDVKVRAA